MRKNYKRNGRKVDKHKINNNINYDEVRLVGDNHNDIYLIDEAMRFADDLDLDLVCINEQSKPPTCKMMDYRKFIYDMEKNKNNQKSIPLKEIRFTPTTHDHDLQTKINSINKFLKKGHKVKAQVWFKGRELRFTEQGEQLLMKVAVGIEDEGLVESMPKRLCS